MVHILFIEITSLLNFQHSIDEHHTHGRNIDTTAYEHTEQNEYYVGHKILDLIARR